MFQSTHPRGVRPMYFCDYSDAHSVSIHAPTWGATPADSATIRALVVSIHAPTWGATCEKQGSNALAMFQSTHPRGVRPIYYGLRRYKIMFQSTHPRGVRHHGFVIPTVTGSFNPRTHVGCDARQRSICARWTMFQSTHPRGVRLDA